MLQVFLNFTNVVAFLVIAFFMKELDWSCEEDRAATVFFVLIETLFLANIVFTALHWQKTLFSFRKNNAERIGIWPSGKAQDFDSCNRWSESIYPCSVPDCQVRRGGILSVVPCFLSFFHHVRCPWCHSYGQCFAPDFWHDMPPNSESGRFLTKNNAVPAELQKHSQCP